MHTHTNANGSFSLLCAHCEEKHNIENSETVQTVYTIPISNQSWYVPRVQA